MATEGLDAAVFCSDLLMARAECGEAEPGLGNTGGFPSEFPYEIDSPVDSVLSSAETTKSGDDQAEEEDFLVELTRRLTRSSEPQAKKYAAPLSCHSKPEKVLAVSVSPKSTLTGLRGWPMSHSDGISRDASPNGGSTTPSPPVTPFMPENSQPDWALIYAAAGQVARLRLTGEKAKQQPIGAPVCPIRSHSLATAMKAPFHTCCSGHTPADGLSVTYQNAQNLQLQRTCSPVPKTVKTNSFSQQIESRVRCIGYESNKGRCSGGRLPGAPQCDWPSLEARNAPQNLDRPNLRALLLNGSGGVKRECAGTGVFLPRRYENSAPESRKRSGCSTVLLPPKVVQALNLNLDDVNARPQQRFTSDYDILMARRSAILAQQRSLHSAGGITHGVHLPQEWTY